jgi:hypothetical protein
VSVVTRIKDAGGWGVESWGAGECGGGVGAQTAEGGQAEEEEEEKRGGERGV